MVTTEQALGQDFDTMRLAVAREAVDRLGLLKREAEAIIYHMLDKRFAEHHPKAICTEYRKDGEQLSAIEKKSIGLRSDAFFSTKAFVELTEKGKKDPLKAHEITLLRAHFTLRRYQTVIQARSENISQFLDDYKYDVLQMDCPACGQLEGIITKGNDAFIFPPSDCACDTANYSLQPYVDWLAGWNDPDS
ncbi:hypothetical protein A8A54_04470 [Brucella pseudogrignonensis]|uniref:hypothetical protein n=1 Tax=Brucella pseudogrignonensis TaxID=419475 RepID=UPI0007DAA57D|nr:hypothetical protein [Brucella pseudogrignonensis]ANG95806.1 hypothetical protein A8A54_04470 [Brucella pseudogrignonensis]